MTLTNEQFFIILGLLGVAAWVVVRKIGDIENPLTGVFDRFIDRPPGDYDQYRAHDGYLQGRVTGGEWQTIKPLNNWLHNE